MIGPIKRSHAPPLIRAGLLAGEYLKCQGQIDSFLKCVKYHTVPQLAVYCFFFLNIPSGLRMCLESLINITFTVGRLVMCSCHWAVSSYVHFLHRYCARGLTSVPLSPSVPLASQALQLSPSNYFSQTSRSSPLSFGCHDVLCLGLPFHFYPEQSKQPFEKFFFRKYTGKAKGSNYLHV